MERDYGYYRQVFENRPMPFAFLDMDLFQQNIQQVIKRVGSKNIRIASKSVRCVELIKKIMDSDERFQGIMSYSGFEAVFLGQKGFNNLLVAYPIWNEKEVTAVCERLKKGTHIVLLVDCQEHIEHLNRIAKDNEVVIPICVEIDVSLNYFGLHFGVLRSGVKTVKQVLSLCEKIKRSSNLKLEGVMGYEAQIAGLPDFSPSFGLGKRLLIRYLKWLSKKEVRKLRKEIVKAILEEGYELSIVNGGGTGSIEITAQEESVTEVTVGSAFYSPKLFDYYKNFRNLPSAGYAIEIVRMPKKHIYTCRGGGYVASGALGKDKLPFPYLPKGAKLTSTEGAGEVQTPIEYKGPEKLKLGDPIFMRHAKAGELCEHFNSLVLVSNGKILGEVSTYRGEGKTFL